MVIKNNKELSLYVNSTGIGTAKEPKIIPLPTFYKIPLFLGFALKWDLVETYLYTNLGKREYFWYFWYIANTIKKINTKGFDWFPYKVRIRKAVFNKTNQVIEFKKIQLPT